MKSPAKSSKVRETTDKSDDVILCQTLVHDDCANHPHSAIEMVVMRCAYGLEIKARSLIQNGKDSTQVPLGSAYLDYFDNELRVIAYAPDSEEAEHIEVINLDIAETIKRARSNRGRNRKQGRKKTT